MSGNISKTFIEETESGKVFYKKVPVDKFDTRSLIFQSNLRPILRGQFNINQYESIEVRPDGSKLSYKIGFKYIDHVPWAPNRENMSLIGQAMAFIHNHCYMNKSQISVPIKYETYDSMLEWAYIVNNKVPYVSDAFNKRNEIFQQIKKLNTDQPKIPLHRDFKPHNILFDGNKYHLIDFDFAAEDFVSIEVMGFVVDIIKSGLGNVESFLMAYLSNIEIPIIPESFVDDYLSYLCTNRFPFYMYDDLDQKNFKNLVDHRNESLETLWLHRDTIEKLIKKLKNETI